MSWKSTNGPAVSGGKEQPPSHAVAVFAAKLLPRSETFIQAQHGAMQRYTPHFLGCREVDGLTLPAGRAVTVTSGRHNWRAWEATFKITGRSARLERYLRQVRPRIVHAHFGHSGTMILPMAERLGLPLVVTYHGYDATAEDRIMGRASLQGRVYLRRRAHLYTQACKLIAVSDFIRRQLLIKGAPPEKTITHYIGVDVKQFSPRPQGTDGRLVLFVGRLVEKKGVRHLIQAMKAVQQRIPDAALLVLGDGPLRGKLEQSAAETIRHCVFRGFVNPDEVRAALNQAAVLALPSVTAPDGDTEGLPMVGLEAQAMGVPVVGTRHGGIPEAVVHEQTGLLSDEGDVPGLARNVVALLSDDSARAEFGRAAFRRVRAQFNLETQVRALEDIYDALAGA